LIIGGLLPVDREILDASSFALSRRLVVEASGHLWPRAAGILRWPLAGTAARDPVLASVRVSGQPEEVVMTYNSAGDEVTLEHGAAVAAALPHGRLAVLPGTHALPVESPDVVNALVLWFLAGAAPAVDWPVPRRGP
jgi:hypothetical protein